MLDPNASRLRKELAAKRNVKRANKMTRGLKQMLAVEKAKARS